MAILKQLNNTKSQQITKRKMNTDKTKVFKYQIK